jgi:hypothetical protein
MDLNIPKVSAPDAVILFPMPGNPASKTDFPFGGIDGGHGAARLSKRLISEGRISKVATSHSRPFEISLERKSAMGKL